MLTRKMIKNYLLLLLFALTVKVIAQPILNESSSLIFQRIKKLNTVASVLYIAAHPDDENTRLLSYLANEKKFRTAYL